MMTTRSTSQMLYVVAIALLMRSFAPGATTHFTYLGEIGGTKIVGVLEFRDDRTVEGAYVREFDFNLETKDPFPIRRLRGRSPQEGTLELDVSLRGRPKGRVLLTKELDAGAGKGEVWRGELKDESEASAPVEFIRSEGVLEGRALINQVSDDQFRAWLTDEAMLDFLRVAKGREGSLDFDLGVFVPQGWTGSFGRDLLPAVRTHTLLPYVHKDEREFKAEVVLVENNQVTLRVRLPPRDDEPPSLAQRLPNAYRQRSGGMLKVPWNPVRDGEFMGVKGQEFSGVFDKAGRLKHLWLEVPSKKVPEGEVRYGEVFVPEWARLLPGERVELSGRRWELPIGDGESTEGSPRLASQRTFTIRPRWWKGEAFGDVGWSPVQGYVIFADWGGEGPVAMESLGKGKDAPQGSGVAAAATKWIDLAAPRGWSDAQEQFSMEHWSARGLPTPQGLQLYKSQPDFVIPWNQIRVTTQ